jgi:hypothetical protein
MNDPTDLMDTGSTYELLEPNVAPPVAAPAKPRLTFAAIATFVMAAAAFAIHTNTLWRSLGGWPGLTSPSAILKDDHPLYLHSEVVTRSFLAQSATTAGYDPTFMAGFAKSAVFPASSSLPEVVVAALGGLAEPAVVHKFYVLACALLAPLVVAWAADGLGHSRRMGAGAMLVWIVYVWTDFPIQYVGFGMIPYFLAIPLALATLRACVAWLEQGGARLWLAMTMLLAATILTHFTALMILGPAAIVAWAFSESKLRKAFAGAASLVFAAAANAFWWWPGVVLAATKGESGFVFAHEEGVLRRLSQILWTEAPVEAFLWTGLAVGLPLIAKSRSIAAAGLAGFAASGFFWGYAAGAFRSFDFLQPGRHTFAFYSSAAIVASYAFGRFYALLAARSRASAFGAALGLAFVGIRIFGPIVVAVVGVWTNPQSAPLASKPPAAYELIFNALKGKVGPGDRVLYEEGGMGPDFFAGGRYSGVLARELGCEFLGGPYLHASLKTNLAQFGEGKLLGRENWDMAWLETVRKRYGLTWIVAWSDSARAVLDANPDRFEYVVRDGALRVARLKSVGKETEAVAPTVPLAGAEHVEGPVQAEPGRIRLTLRPAQEGIAVDRDVVLRYHWAPNLEATGPEGVVVLQESLPDAAFPPLIRLRLKPGAQGPTELRIGVWGPAFAE